MTSLIALKQADDTEWTDALVSAAAGADLFIREAYFHRKRVPFHLDYETLMQQRREQPRGTTPRR